MVAFLGADGSGKSTVVGDISATLAQKMDVLRLYFGSGDGPVSLLRWPMKAVFRVASRRKRRDLRPTSPQGSAPAKGGLGRIATVLWAVALAVEKRATLARAIRGRDRGMVVICDRFPQTQFPGVSDGPLLGALLKSNSALLRALGKWEHDTYSLAMLNPPDLVVKLVVSPEVAFSRKPSTGLEVIYRKVEVLNALVYPPQVSVRCIDADAPLNTVLVEARRLVWEIV